MADESLAAYIDERIQESLTRLFFRATVAGTAGGAVLIMPQSQAGTDTIRAARLDTYTPTVADEVLGLYIPNGRGGYSALVLGKASR